MPEEDTSQLDTCQSSAALGYLMGYLEGPRWDRLIELADCPEYNTGPCVSGLRAVLKKLTDA